MNQKHLDDMISRQAAIDALCEDYCSGHHDCKRYPKCENLRAIQELPSAETDLVTVIQNGIKATNADDEYSCGMRNGMRWCKSLIDDKEPLYENCPSAQPAPQRTFVELVVEYPKPELCPYKEYKGKPYYSIKYIENGETYVGYGTYKPKVLSQYLSEYFISSAQPERLTDDDFETIRIHLNAYKEKLCNQQRWKEAEEYQRIIDRFMAFASAQPEITRCKDCLMHGVCRFEQYLGLDGYCSKAERRTDG